MVLNPGLVHEGFVPAVSPTESPRNSADKAHPDLNDLMTNSLFAEPGSAMSSTAAGEESRKETSDGDTGGLPSAEDVGWRRIVRNFTPSYVISCPDFIEPHEAPDK